LKNTIFLIIVTLELLLFSCKNENTLGKSMAPEATVSSDMALPQEAREKTISQDQTPVTDRRIIKEGEISFETSDKDETRKIINKAVKESNAYIAQDNITDHSYRIENRITIRVPSEKFEDLLTRISEIAVELDSKNISATDITEEYVDVESRLKTKKELENRYKVLLQKARSVDEILKIEKQIGDIRTEIESIEGRYKYLNDRISYSTLTVVFYEKNRSDFGFSSKLGQGIKNGWENVLWVIIGLINLWPFLILLVTVVFIILRKRRNKK
jgi:hypothetical protein